MTRTLFASMLFVSLGAGASAQTPPPTQTPPPLLPKPSPTAPAAAPAQALPFPADSKFAFVNMQELLSESLLGKAGVAQMKTLTDKQQSDLVVKNNAIVATQQRIQQQSTVVTPAALAVMNADLDKAQRDLQFARNEAQAQAEELNQKLLVDFQDKVLPIINALAKEKNLYGVLSVQDSGALFFNPALDLTAEVIKRLDVKFPGGK